MFTYICLGTNDLPRAIRFYDAVLATLGISRFDTSAPEDPQGWAGWGTCDDAGRVQLALWLCTPFDGAAASAGNGTMVALRATNWSQVDRFHEAALASGGRSDGPPGLRLQYGADFYATYVRDPDGNKLAVVCRGFTARQDVAGLDAAKARAAATYNAAADIYDDPMNSFWARFGGATIARIGLRPGERVLDVCCGSGASALPAALAVGPDGSVLGVDLAERLLALARAKADKLGLRNIEFRTGDMLALNLPAASFDAVVCVFGIFFVPDMAAAVSALWHLVRPGGKLVITTWGPRWFEPATSVFWNAIREVRPDLYKGFNPWDRVCDPPSLRDLLRASGVVDTQIVAEPGEHAIASPEAWWAAVLGTGYRGTVEQLSAQDLERVRATNLDYVRRSQLRAVEANVVYAIATKA